MSVLGRVGITLEPPPQRASDQGTGAQKTKVQQKLDKDPIGDRAAVTGVADASLPRQPSGQPGQTIGITFAAGQAIEIAHGLGRAATGFLVKDAQLSAPALFNDLANLSPGLSKTHIRLKHSGAATTKVSLVVL